MEDNFNNNKFNNNNNQVFQQIKNSINQEKGKKIVVVKKRKKKKGNYILGETIGEGAFAKVKLATHIYTGEKVAIKILNKEKINKSSDIKKIKKEITILQKLKHKNIIQLYEIMETNKNLYIVMEYCEGKELFDLIVRKKRLTERESCRYFQQLINGVEYLHLSNVTHRDLKPENLLLDNKKRILISDFGLSILSNNNNSLLSTPCGTPSYAPPEMLRGEKYNGIYSDLWSCGIILYTMLVGNLPCSESKEELVYQNIITHNFFYPENLSDDAIDLIEHILKINPDERYGFEEIKAHPWFNLLTPKLRPGIVFKVHKIPIDNKILDKVEEYGYDRKKVEESVINYRFDSFCAIYYLILKQFKKKGINSVSDLFSNDYLNYLKDYKNWIDTLKINDPLFKDYEVELIDTLFEDEMLWMPEMNSPSELSNINIPEDTDEKLKTIIKENNDNTNIYINENNDKKEDLINNNTQDKENFEDTFDKYIINDQMINDMIINVTKNYIKNKNKSIENNQTIESANTKFDKNKWKKNKNKSYKNQLTPNNANFRIKSKIQNINDKRNDFNYKNKTESNATENNNNKFEKSSYKTLIINSPESINSNKTIRINKKLSLSDKNIIENLNELEPKYLSPNSTRKCKTNKRYKNNFNKNNKLNIIISPLRTSTDKVLTHRRNYEINLSDFENNNFNINEKTENYRIRIKRAKKKENEKMILLAEELNQKRKEEIYNKLKEEEEKFNEELKSFDNISLLNSPMTNFKLTVYIKLLIKIIILKKRV